MTTTTANRFLSIIRFVRFHSDPARRTIPLRRVFPSTRPCVFVDLRAHRCPKRFGGFFPFHTQSVCRNERSQLTKTGSRTAVRLFGFPKSETRTVSVNRRQLTFIIVFVSATETNGHVQLRACVVMQTTSVLTTCSLDVEE